MLKRIAILAFLAATPAFATENCKPVAEFNEMLAAHPEWTALAHLTPEQVTAAVDIYNAVPPATDAQFAAVWLVERADGVGAMVLGSPEEVCVVQPFSARDFQAIKRTLGILNS